VIGAFYGIFSSIKRLACALVIVSCGLSISACSNLEQNIALGAIGATILGAQAPSHEIEQIYYVGSFDPLGQYEPQMYRIRVHGQASFISQVNFASGWIRAELIDTLGTTLKFEESAGGVSVKNVQDTELMKIGGNRKLFQFGPEGTRKVPENHRLVIVMGSNPEGFFQAVDNALGSVAGEIASRQSAKLTRDIFEALVRVESESQRLSEIQKDVAVELKSD